jgi:hypothetical protein
MSDGQNAYRMARQLCGLSIEEAADFHQVEKSVVEAWDRGDVLSVRHAWVDLISLHDQIQRLAAVEARRLAVEQIPPDFYYECPQLDALHDALPCEGARRSAGVLALMGAFQIQLAVHKRQWGRDLMGMQTQD